MWCSTTATMQSPRNTSMPGTRVATFCNAGLEEEDEGTKQSTGLIDRSASGRWTLHKDPARREFVGLMPACWCRPFVKPQVAHQTKGPDPLRAFLDFGNNSRTILATGCTGPGDK